MIRPRSALPGQLVALLGPPQHVLDHAAARAERLEHRPRQLGVAVHLGDQVGEDPAEHVPVAADRLGDEPDQVVAQVTGVRGGHPLPGERVDRGRGERRLRRPAPVDRRLADPRVGRDGLDRSGPRSRGRPGARWSHPGSRDQPARFVVGPVVGGRLRPSPCSHSPSIRPYPAGRAWKHAYQGARARLVSGGCRRTSSRRAPSTTPSPGSRRGSRRPARRASPSPGR